jgi:hypothetical protein
MENAGLIRNKSPKHIQGRHLGLEPARPSRGRILPSSTADVQAAIAAIQARSAALRRQQQNAVSIVNPKENRTDGVSGRSQINKRDSIDDDSSIDSDDVNEDYFANIGNLIDGVNGIQNKENEEESIYSSDSDESSDMSLGEDGKVVSAATKLNIGAFIDSLNAAAKMPISDSQNEIDNVKMNEPKDYGDNIFAKKEKVPTMAGSEVPVQYDELKLDAYINKALDVASRSRDAGSNPNFERLESVIFYAWKNKVPIIPVIDAFDDAMKERQECSATRFTYFVRKAVRLVEEDTFDDKKSLALLKTMQAKRLDTSFLKAMFKNPEKHVVYHDIVAHIENLNFIDTTLEKEREKENKSSDDLKFTDGSPRKFARVNHVYLSQKMQQLSNAHSHYLRDVEISCIPDIDSVSSSRKILTEKVFLQHPTITPFRVEHWKLSEEERKNRHSGYHGVHAKSLSNTASQAGIFHISESFKWEQVELELTKKRRLVDTANWVGKCACIIYVCYGNYNNICLSLLTPQFLSKVSLNKLVKIDE